VQITHAGMGSQTAHAISTARRAQRARLRRFCARNCATATGNAPTMPAGPRRGRRARPALLTVLMAVALTFAAPTLVAHAGVYDIAVCGLGDGQPGTADGLTTGENPGAGYFETLDRCTNSDPNLLEDAFLPNSTYRPPYWNGDGHWTLTAPSGTTIASATMTRTFQGFESFFTYDLTTPDGRLLERAATWGGGSVSSGKRTFVVNAPSLQGRFYCATSSCTTTSGTSVTITGLTPTIEDDHPPTFDSPPTGSLFAPGSVSGLRGVSYSATDIGGGIYKVSLLVDGQVQQSVVPDTNGGHCAKPFTMLVPCALHVTGALSVDTTKLSEGQHDVRLAVTDATETGTATSAPQTITVDNVPLPSGGIPAISGQPTAGKTLSALAGVWDGAVSFAYQWQRCETTGTGCAFVGSGMTYVVPFADAGSRLRVRVTAYNSAGEPATALSALTNVVGNVPSVVPEVPVPSSSSLVPSLLPATNGSNAGPRVLLSAAFARGRHTVLTTAGRRVRITGRLVNASNGRPITAARIEETIKPTAGSPHATVRTVTTSPTGTFSVLLSRTAPSEALRFAYRPGATSSVVASVKLRLRVRASIRWRASSSHRILRFGGTVPGPVPAHPVQYVEVQWRRGASWATLAHPVAVARSGRWSLTYAVGGAVPTGARFEFRASIRSTSAGYPYEAASTAPRWVVVR
jgi:hypothetical protein